MFSYDTGCTYKVARFLEIYCDNEITALGLEINIKMRMKIYLKISINAKNSDVRKLNF